MFYQVCHTSLFQIALSWGGNISFDELWTRFVVSPNHLRPVSVVWDMFPSPYVDVYMLCSLWVP